MRIEPLPALAGLLLLAGCAGADGHVASTTPAFGEAVRQTFAAQVIDPAPEYAEANPVTSGGRAALAVERYETDKVKLPDRTATSSLSTGGGGAGGGK